MTKTEYVAGFLFDPDKHIVALIKKNRPIWQAGRYNAIGGHIEGKSESPLRAMRREFKEETGVKIRTWDLFCEYHGKENYVVYFFRSFSKKVLDVKTITDERVTVYPISIAITGLVLDNLKWLIPLALDGNITFSIHYEQD